MLCVWRRAAPVQLRDQVVLAYTAGGTRPPVTALRVVSEEALGNLLAESAAVAAAASSDPTVLLRAGQGVLQPALAAAYGWELVGRLPHGRCLVAQYGQGSPLVSVTVFRAPVAVPRYGQSRVLDLLPAGYGAPPAPTPASPLGPLRPEIRCVYCLGRCAGGRGGRSLRNGMGKARTRLGFIVCVDALVASCPAPSCAMGMCCLLRYCAVLC